MRSRRAVMNVPREKPCPSGSVMVVTLMTVVVLTVMALTILTLSSSEDSNMRRERREVLAFYAAEAGVQEALHRMNLDPSGAGNDETEVLYGTGSGNPDSIRDPKVISSCSPVPDATQFSDSAVPSYRFWNYNPTWRFSGTNTSGSGNYPGATAAQQANLADAGRHFSYVATSSRSLPANSNYAVGVVPHVRNFSGTWAFANQAGSQAAANYYFWNVTSTGSNGDQTATVQVLVTKFCFGVDPSIPAALTAGGNVVVSGNGSVSAGTGENANPTNVAIQSAGTATTGGSGTISGSVRNSTAFPGFETIFGTTKDGAKTWSQNPSSGIYASYTSSPDPNPGAVPSGTAGKVIWLTAMNGGVKQDVKFNAGFTLGSPTEPVVLFVDGNLEFQSVTIYGVVYVTGTFKNTGKSSVEGAILVEGTAETDILGTGDGSKIEYNKGILGRIGGSSNLFPFRPTKGTWKMTRG